ncbi:hypothetical protein PV416_01235 [Streptomyces ipomoeae]|uniref:hypothetical protein n=1 Tax=Streptomyces ipomoeae TaxID=103232 RepID=UPI0029BA10D6|nr:hypothetical protein [Streptomyces ipomoeae]MDX2819737.1 hypothetical protein [Streptomyces ipomoeae]MDX2874711.1 hypothetical protein [Streptomyces ipomoeae]
MTSRLFQFTSQISAARRTPGRSTSRQNKRRTPAGTSGGRLRRVRGQYEQIEKVAADHGNY